MVAARMRASAASGGMRGSATNPPDLGPAGAPAEPGRNRADREGGVGPGPFPRREVEPQVEVIAMEAVVEPAPPPRFVMHGAAARAQPVASGGVPLVELRTLAVDPRVNQADRRERGV